MSYASTRPTSITAEKALYLVLRLGVALAGLLVFLATLSGHFLTPALLYDEAPGPPPLRERIPGIVLSLGIGVLLCVPHRWTRGESLFWPRFTVYVLLAAFVLWRAAEGMIAGIGGGKSWHIFPVSIAMACLAVALPLSLLWSRRIGRAT